MRDWCRALGAGRGARAPATIRELAAERIIQIATALRIDDLAIGTLVDSTILITVAVAVAVAVTITITITITITVAVTVSITGFGRNVAAAIVVGGTSSHRYGQQNDTHG
jgi:hypothetical protein